MWPIVYRILRCMKGGEGEKDKVEAGWNIKVKGYKLVCVI